jgi:hypothetical protein
MWLGDYKEDETVYFLWSTNDGDGASITRATNGTVSVYKDNGTTQSVAGVTDTEDFDGLTGIHACTIDLSADAFYATGADYSVVLSAATIDGQTVNAVLAHFSIENRFNEVDVTKWLGQACAAVTENGVPEVDLTFIAGAAVSTTTAQLGANAVQVSGSATAANNAEIVFDTDFATNYSTTNDKWQAEADVLAINGSAAAAVRQALAAATIVSGTAQTGTLSTTQMTTDLSEATDDHYNGRLVIWTSGALQNQATTISDYENTGGLVTFVQTTEAPANNDTFIII